MGSAINITATSRIRRGGSSAGIPGARACARWVALMAALPLTGAADEVLRGTPPDENMWFGRSVAASAEDIIAVGAPLRDDNKGAVFVFRRVGDDWQPWPVLTEPVPENDVALYGQSVSIRDDVLVVGAATLDVAGHQDRGAIFVYQRVETSPNTEEWVGRTTLISPGGAPFDTVGNSVAQSDDFIVAGAPGVNGSEADAGRAYVWRRTSDSSWIFHQTLSPPSDGRQDRFGDRVAITGDYIFVCAPDRDQTATDSGAVFVFKKGGGGSFTLHQTLTPAIGVAFDRFGNDVAADGTLLVVGATGFESSGVALSGSAFVFREEEGSWVQDGPPLSSPTPHALDVFGRSVAVRNQKVVIGSPGNDGQGSSAGAVFTFSRSDSGWTFATRPVATDDDPLRFLGDDVAVGNTVFVAGGYPSGDGGTVHVFNCAPAPLVFIPGIAGSVLTQGTTEVWPSIRGSTICKLALPDQPGGAITATDVLRTAEVIGPLGPDFYGNYLDHLVDDREFVEYEIAGNRELLFDAEHMKSLDPKPTLFPFPYDWRRPSADNAVELGNYIDTIRQLYPDQKVHIVAHSMGSLVARRYLLDKGDAAVERVATVGAPYWGAPVAIYRMIVGEFFDIPGVDELANKEVRKTLATLPGFFELLPTTLYHALAAAPVIRENGRDGNGNDSTDDVFTRDEVWDFINARANASGPPSQVNGAFHTVSQDDWSNDTQAVNYLHIVGEVTDPREGRQTTIGVELVERPSFDIAKLSRRYREIKGRGDGTVPLLSAERTGNHLAPGDRTTMRTIPGGSRVTHNGMMQNEDVWNMIAQFLNGQPVDQPPSPFASRVAAGSIDEVRITIYGASWALIQNAVGDWNSPLGDIGFMSVPGLSIEYGGEDEWIEIRAPADELILIDSGLGNGAVEIEIEIISSGGGTQSLERYRFEPGALSWRLEFTGTQASTWLDADGDETFAPEEQLTPSHSASGSAVDLTPPNLTVTVSRVAGAVRVSYSASDEAGSANIRYRIDDGPLTDYTNPLELSSGSGAIVRCAAEDGAGNLSGLMETAIEPSLDTERFDEGYVLTLSWPVADGYLLEEKTGLAPWQPSLQAVLREGNRRRVRVSLEEPVRLYRLRSSALTK